MHFWELLPINMTKLKSYLFIALEDQFSMTGAWHTVQTHLLIHSTFAYITPKAASLILISWFKPGAEASQMSSVHDSFSPDWPFDASRNGFVVQTFWKEGASVSQPACVCVTRHLSVLLTVSQCQCHSGRRNRIVNGSLRQPLKQVKAFCFTAGGKLNLTTASQRSNCLIITLMIRIYWF